jgi:hypothetical protein
MARGLLGPALQKPRAGGSSVKREAGALGDSLSNGQLNKADFASLPSTKFRHFQNVRFGLARSVNP